MITRYHTRPIVGFGTEQVTPPATTTSPWTVAVGTTLLGVVASWALESVTRKTRGKKR